MEHIVDIFSGQTVVQQKTALEGFLKEAETG